MSVGLTLNSTLPLSEGYKIWITLFFILTFSGIVISGIWIFKYGVTTEDIDNGNKIDSKNKENLIIAGSILTVLSTVITIATIRYLHSKGDNEKKIVSKNIGSSRYQSTKF